jgi:hypothetical protein
VIRSQRGKLGESDDALGLAESFDTLHPLLHEARRRESGPRCIAAGFVGRGVADAVFLPQASAGVLIRIFVRRGPPRANATLPRVRRKLDPQVGVPPLGRANTSGDACQAAHHVSTVGD